MAQWSKSVLAGVYGADEFVYLLQVCLVNYGSVISTGIHQHIKGTPEDTSLGSTQPPETEDEGNVPQHQNTDPSSRPGNWKASTAKSASPLNGNRREPWSQQPTTERLRSYGGSQRHEAADEHEAQLRETIRSMRVDIENDASVLEFSEISGLESVKVALEEFACFFLNFPHLTRNLRQRSTTGILLFGAQGTGKTLLVKSFASKFNLALYDIRASAIMSKFVGESEKFIKALFKEVRSSAPAVLMLDECEGLLCDPSSDMTQSHNYRLLQNELKNQWSDLIYSHDEVIVIGATNKPFDIDLDGFGRRLSLKLHVDLPNAESCKAILKQALSRVRHCLEDGDIETLGVLCHEKQLSGYDIDCLVEGRLRREIRAITVAKAFKRVEWDGSWIVVPCSEEEGGATSGSWTSIAENPEEVSYWPFSFGQVHESIAKARPTVDKAMRDKHSQYAKLHGTEG